MTDDAPATPSAPSASGGQTDRRVDPTWFWQASVALVAVGLFAHSVGFGWVYDDQLEIVGNVLVHSLDRLPEFFTSTVWAGSGMETFLYRPLALLTYALNHQLSGLEPWSYHLVNILLHAAVSVLVFRIGRLWGLSSLAAGMGGLLFAIHPVHVEVVAAVFGRKDLLAACFILMMVLGHRAALTEGGWRYLLPVAAFSAALLSKEIGVAGLLLVTAQDLALDGGPRKLAANARAPGLYIAYLVVLLTYLLVRNTVTGVVGVPGTSPLDNPLVAAGLFSRLATALVVIGHGVVVQVAPLTLSPDYSFDTIPLVESVLDPRFLGVLAALSAVLWWVRPGERRGTAVPLALAWYFLALLPTANLLLPVGTIFGERLLYLPSVSACLLAGMGIKWLWTRRSRAVLIGVAAWAVALAAQTVRYSSAWDNDLALFRWAVAHVPESTKAHHKLGEELLRAGEEGDAVRSLRRALEIAPDNEFAAVTMAQARGRVAERYLSPSTRSGSGELPSDPDLLYVLAQVHQERGDTGEAELLLQRALTLNSRHPEALAAMGLLQLVQGDTTAALAHLHRAVEAKPSLANAWFNLGRIYLKQGEYREAQTVLRSFMRRRGSRYADQAEWAREVLAELATR
jgi:tetratricopeptide (TPR) repeat protein